MMESGRELIRDNKERIFVSVRLRPLNEKEISSNDVSDWECVNGDTIVYKNVTLHTSSERSMYPTAYKFDRVFRSECSTRAVYEQGAKDVAISVVHGVNFLAYGQTSSGKTYTMTGITEYAITDIYQYIQKHPERDFILKFSAMEIYNESIQDLLSVDSAPLRLLDDPQRGAVVENLTEETIRDRDHATELLFICEAQRQTGETLLNEMSSVSHQIIRLTIESSPRVCLGRDNASTLAATVNFVDLTGSERASQLKEGSHIDKSLLTLGTVIGKLSKERNGHIPYSDSKLTQILEKSLGGNARTAIICTMSPAHSHVEQSRNTLLFASCAKEVTTNANVNVVVSDKTLVKHLQKELARLENEMRSNQSNFPQPNYPAIIREKDAQIEKLEKEIKDLILQRDIAQSQVKELLQMLGDDARNNIQVGLGNYPHLRVQKSAESDAGGLSRCSSQYHTARVPYFDENFEQSNASPSILTSCSNFSESDSYYGNLEDLCRKVRSMDTEDFSNRETTETDNSYSEEEAEAVAESPAIRVHVNESTSSTLKDHNEVKKDRSQEPMTERKESISPSPENLSLTNHLAKYSLGTGSLNMARSTSNGAGGTVDSASPWFGSEKECEKCGSILERSSSKDCKSPENEMDTFAGKFSTSENCTCSTSDMQEKSELGTENTKPDKENAAENESVKKNEKDGGSDQSGDEHKGGLTSWPVEFKRLQREILELWHACNVSLVHRTYFFLLFQGDPSDAIYLEVEIRRMKLLKDKFTRGDKVLVDGKRLTLSSSAKALRQERRMLSEQMMKKFSEQQRDGLFVEWGIGLNTKLRRLQLAHRLWSNTEDINHITDSAFLVAKLVGFIEPGQTPSKEMLGINFTPNFSTGICSFKRSLGSLL